MRVFLPSFTGLTFTIDSTTPFEILAPKSAFLPFRVDHACNLPKVVLYWFQLSEATNLHDETFSYNTPNPPFCQGGSPLFYGEFSGRFRRFAIFAAARSRPGWGFRRIFKKSSKSVAKRGTAAARFSKYEIFSVPVRK